MRKAQLKIVTLVHCLVVTCWSLVPPIAQESHLDHKEAALPSLHLRRVRREVTVLNRTNCRRNDKEPANRVNTTSRLRKLRNIIPSIRDSRGGNIAAYIITSDDAHQSEYVAARDQRRAYISGFTGSAGTAIVTANEAALWTDGRYFLQADDQLDCNWLLMKTDMPGVPTFSVWLSSQLRPGERVGADPKLIGAHTWGKWSKELESYGLKLVPVRTNLVDEAWSEKERPPPSSEPIYVHQETYAGEPWQDKVQELREELAVNQVDVMVVTALDEIAWLFNLRGNDVPYNPVFHAYAVITPDSVHLYVSQDKVTDSVRIHLNTSCSGPYCVKLHGYSDIFFQLPQEVRNWNRVLLPSRFSYAGGASYAIFELVSDEKRLMTASPIMFMKARKNPTEIKGMKRAHIRDSVALCRFLALLDEEVPNGVHWDELKAAKKLAQFRSKQSLFQYPSFETISAFGPNGAIIHYVPSDATNRVVDTSSLYLLDSGGQYLDGTTDVTRTMHYGRPTPLQKEMYTRVLMGMINLATAIFPDGTTDTDLDLLARMPLYETGVKYRHGTGHGIGAFLNVHEGPIQITNYGREQHIFEEGQFLSNEPGYYKDHDFGIRLEDIVHVVRHKTPYGDNSVFYGFEPVTLVPFEPKLIIPELMSQKQRKWLNEYNALVRIHVGQVMKSQDHMKAFHWLMGKTGYVDEGCGNGQQKISPAHTFFLVLMLGCARWFNLQGV